MQEYLYTSFSKIGDLDFILISHPQFSAEISLFGGQLTSFVPQSRKRELIYLSPNSLYDKTKSLRGGVPICWPWFGNHKTDSTLPAHGVVRTMDWAVQSISEADNQVTVKLSINYSNVSLVVTYTLSNELSISLTTHNNREDNFSFTQALHTYFDIDSINTVKASPLQHNYLDKVSGFDKKLGQKDLFFAGETDRIYLMEGQPIMVKDSAQQFCVINEHNDSVVIWNPGAQKSEQMKDLGKGEYENFICIESANTQETISLPPGQSYTLKQHITF